jgi:hypothetical protein
MCKNNLKRLLTLFFTERPAIDCQPKGFAKVKCEKQRSSNCNSYTESIMLILKLLDTLLCQQCYVPTTTNVTTNNSICVTNVSYYKTSTLKLLDG